METILMENQNSKIDAYTLIVCVDVCVNETVEEPSTGNIYAANIFYATLYFIAAQRELSVLTRWRHCSICK